VSVGVPLNNSYPWDPLIPVFWYTVGGECVQSEPPGYIDFGVGTGLTATAPSGDYIVNCEGVPTITNDQSYVVDTSGGWTYLALPDGARNPVAINDSHDVLVGEVYDPGTSLPADSYLFDMNGITTTLFQDGNNPGLIPILAQPGLRYVLPLLMSNRLTPTGTAVQPVLYIVFNAEIRVDAATQTWSQPTNLLLTLLSDGTTNLQQINVPSASTDLRLLSINSSGVIAAIGNAGTGDGHALLLVPEDIIQVDAFIPQTWVQEPFGPYHPFTSYIDNGNSRKNPLDASLTSGSSLFIESSPEFKVRQTLNVCTFDSYDPDGSQEAASKKTTVGGTQQYNASVLVNGEVPAGATPTKTGKATPYIDYAHVSHPSPESVAAGLEMIISNPLVFGASLAPIQYFLSVTIDRSNPGQPTFSIKGTFCEFPAYEIYINDQLVYSYDPIPGGDGPNSLLLGPENLIEISGTLSH
jgi:hypothetical protein